jgi:predicted NBD/HSP70 family sugar kinase
MKTKSQPKGGFEINVRQRTALRLLWRAGRLSRSDLHEQTGVNPNAIGTDIIGLLREEIVRECQPSPDRRGRPRVPLEIDSGRRQVLGLAISGTHVEIARLNLRGDLIGKVIGADADGQEKTIEEGRKLLNSMLSDRVLGVGLSTTGFINQETHSFRSALPGRPLISLEPLYDEIGGMIPITLENNMHALAARWMLTHEAESDEDVLLVGLSDGQLGAAILVEGRPNKGSESGSNELGHTRFFVETDACYCGHMGCIERIFSTSYVQRFGGQGTLYERAAAMDPADAGLTSALDHLGTALSNAVNFLRPHRLVLTSELAKYPAFTDYLRTLIQRNVLSDFAQQLRIDFWQQPTTRSAETAGWLALATIYREGWTRPTERGTLGQREVPVVSS